MEIGNGELVIILGGLYGLAEVIALTPLKSNSTFQLVYNILKTLTNAMRGKKGGFTRLRLLVVVAMLSLAVLALQGCATGMARPDQPGEVLAALEADYTTAVVAAKSAHDAGILHDNEEELIDSLVEKIGYYFDRAEAAFKTGDRPGQNEWVKLIEPLVFELLMAVPK